MESKKYYSTTEVAKEIRKVLKAEFPKTKFSVRSKSYSGGSSIRIEYQNGPAYAKVNDIAKQFEGAGFDGMQDLKYYKAGVHPTTGEAVTWGVDFVFVTRNVDMEIQREIVNDLAGERGWEVTWYDYGWQCKEYYQDRFLSEAINEWDEYTVYEDIAEDNNDSQETEESGASFNVEYDRDWTWIKFEHKPAEEIRSALKELGARWSKKRVAWYIRERVEIAQISAVVA